MKKGKGKARIVHLAAGDPRWPRAECATSNYAGRPNLTKDAAEVTCGICLLKMDGRDGK